jgi:hypothetical protein
MLLLFA